MLAMAKEHVLIEAHVGAPSPGPHEATGQPNGDVLCCARQHRTAHLHTLFLPKGRLPAHLIPQNHPT